MLAKAVQDKWGKAKKVKERVCILKALVYGSVSLTAIRGATGIFTVVRPK